MMRLLQRHYKISVSRQAVVNRTLLGTWEILQMMDYDLRNTPCIELAECHHLAWVLGRVAALRPGSLARARNQTQELPYLVWKDLSIERTEIVGKFIVRMTIRNLKTNSPDPEAARSQNRELTISLHCPAGQLTFELSAPHRILTIALRRGILKKINTVDELFNGKEKFIVVKDEFKDKPILLAGKKRGLAIDAEKPMASDALTDYMQSRARDIGLIEHVSFYSFRRNTAYSLSESLGPEMARAVMAHDPSSVILEKYYTTNRTLLINLTAIAVREDLTIATEDQLPPLALTKLNDGQIRELGPVLNQLFMQLCEGDEEYPHEGTKAEKKNRDRVLRRAAWRSVLKDIRTAQTENLTIEEIRARANDLQAMHNEFNLRLLAQAKHELDGHSSHDDGATDAAGVDFNQDFHKDNEETPEPDAENQFAEQVESGEVIETFPDELYNIPGEISALPYAAAARAAMEVWLSVGTEESTLRTKHYQKSVC
ncbi:hypothetical protein F66182_4674 [Fusarium sp. NRRL 66182]|nr:hypothetical protein F66182_4674 [Fusarium sp. NRRL 66182]